MTQLPGRRATTATVVAAVAAALAGTGTSITLAATEHGSATDEVFQPLMTVVLCVAGAVLAAARPRNAVGWLMLAGGTLSAVGTAAIDLAYRGIVVEPGSVPAASALAVSGSVVRSLGWFAITPCLPIWFPAGRPRGRRWRHLDALLVAVVAGSVIDPLTDPQAGLTYFGHWHNPVAPPGAGQLVSGAAFLCHIPLTAGLTIAAVVHLSGRWRRGDAVVRQQIGLVAAALALTVVAAPAALLTSAGGWIFTAAAIPLPIAIGVAVLAHGLYDLRTAANRTLVWALLSVVVAAIYGGLITGLAAALHVGRAAGWLPWLAGGIVAVSVLPLRDVLQRAVNRLTFGRWDQPYDVLAELGQRVEDTIDVRRLLRHVAAELESLGLRRVAIADAAGSVLAGGSRIAEPATDAPPLTAVGLSAYGEVVGTLSYQLPDQPLRERDHRLLDDIAGQLAGVLHAHRLTLDLHRARERLVLTREEERRRLRRDLHDGLGPALAGHLLRLDVLASRYRTDPAAAAEIDELRHDLRGTMLEVRRVVEGLRPPALDELGLSGALRQAMSRISASGRTSVRLVGDDLPPLPAAVEVAAFRIVTEAVTNVVKHALADRCTVEFSVGDAALRIVVTDDGIGIAGGATDGHGLHTMHERAEELRGALELRRGPDGRGTSIVAELPLAEVPRQQVPEPVEVTA